jgi:hypothetical protein
VTDEHLSLDELAELDEGILTPERASAVQAHLDGCAQCRAAADAIAATRGILADLPDEPMPDSVKARLEAALADAAPTSSATVVPQLETYRRRRLGRPTAAASAAAAAIVLVVGAIVVAAVGHGGTSSGGPGGADTAGSAPFPTAEPVQPKDYKRTSTGLNYTPSGLLSDIPGLVASVPGAATFGAGKASTQAIAPSANGSGTEQSLESGPVPKALRPLFDSRTKLLQCAVRMTGESNAVPLAIDFARWTNGEFHSAPSIFLVFRDPNPEVVDVYVAAPDCGTGDLRTYVKVPLQ